MAAVLFYLVAAAALLAAGIRAGRLRTSGNQPAARAYVLLLSALGTTFAVMAPPSQAWVNRAVPDLFKLVGNCSTLVAAFGAEMLVLFTSHPADEAKTRIPPRMAGLLLAAAVLIAMFFYPHPVELTGSFDAYEGSDPTLAVYTLAYALYLGTAVGDVTIMCCRFSQHTAGALRIGLRVIAAAGAIGVLYAIGKIAILARHIATGSHRGAGNASGVCHSPFSSPACAVAVGVPGVAVLALVVGVLLAVGAARLDRARHWIGQYRAYRQLEPLWRELCDVLPEIAHAPAEPRRPTASRDVPLRLARRLVQIRDGLLILAPYRDPDIAADVHAAIDRTGIAKSEIEATVEAAQIAAAIRTYLTGAPPAPGPPEPPAQHPDQLDTETAWLQRVCRAFVHSPVVASYHRPSTKEPCDPEY